MKSFYYAKILTALLLLNGCSILIGQVKPVEEKAVEPNLVEVHQLDPNWKKLEVKSEHQGTKEENEDIPDAAWQSTKTAAVISLNSACRQTHAEADGANDLREMTETITSPWSNLKILSQDETLLSGFPSLQTIAEGIYLNRKRKFQLIVVKAPSCVYDIIFLSPVPTYEQDLSVFEKFRATLKLK